MPHPTTETPEQNPWEIPELDQQRYLRLKENEIDLEIELHDLEGEVRDRVERIGEVLIQLSHTRLQIRDLQAAA